MPREDWLTVGEARELLDVSKGTMTRLLKDGVLVAVRDSVDRRVLLVPRADVERLAATHRSRHKSEPPASKETSG